MPLRAEDLPPEVRKRLGVAGSPKATRKAAKADEPCPYRCACGEEFASFGGRAGFEAHASREGHHRGGMILSEAS